MEYDIKQEIYDEYKKIVGDYDIKTQPDNCSSYFILVKDDFSGVHIQLKNNRFDRGGLAFDNWPKAKQLVDTVGEDLLLKYWFRVKE